MSVKLLPKIWGYAADSTTFCGENSQQIASKKNKSLQESPKSLETLREIQEKHILYFGMRTIVFIDMYIYIYFFDTLNAYYYTCIIFKHVL